MKHLIYIFIICISSPLFSQERELESDKDTSYSQIKILFSDTFINESEDEGEVQYYRGNVKILHDSTFMFCDSATTKNNIMDAVGDIAMIRKDTLQVFGDSLHYDGNSKYAELYGNVALINGEEEMYSDALYYDMKLDRVSYQDTALMKSKNSKLSSLTGYYDLASDKAYFFGEVLVIDSSLTLRTDTLIYDTEISRANFYGPTYIHQSNNKIYCESGYYDTESGYAYFEKNTRFYGDSLQSTASYMEYDQTKNAVILTGDAKVVDGDTEAIADRIQYFEQDSLVILEGNASYKDDETQAFGDFIRFDNNNDEVIITGQGRLIREEVDLSADSIYYDMESEEGSSFGQVVFEDTLNQRLLYSDVLDQKGEEEYIAFNVDKSRPYLEDQGDSDTLFLSADTLRTIQKIDSLDTINLLRAYHEVRMFSGSMQGMADSLEYNTADSTITFFGSPVLWSDTTQFVADTIIVYNNEEGIEKVDLLSNAMISNKLGYVYYDQIKGKTIHAKLDSNEIQWMEVKGNAEVIYMLRDEGNAFIGANKTLCSYIEFYFDKGELSDIKFHKKPTSNMVPVLQAGDTDLYLDNFIWYEDKRPYSLEDILIIDGAEKIEDPTENDNFEKQVKEIMDKIEDE